MLLIACSGPCVGYLISRSNDVGYLGAALTLGLLAPFVWMRVRTGRWFRAGASLVWALVNPGWWFSAYGGDCGITRVWAAELWLSVAAGLFSAELFRRS